ncbi:MAG: MutS-related protein [Limisphaerales bacterium]
MKAHLMYPDRDFGLQQESLATQPYRKVEVRPKLLSNEDALIQDLELNTLFNAMAGGDKFLFAAARQAVLSGLRDDLETIRYRQAVLKDTLRNVSIVKTIYDVALEAIEHERRRWWGIFSKNYPSGTLHSAVELVQMFMGKLSQLKRLADEHSDKFESEGFRTFFAMLKAELADEYFASVKAHLKELKFGQGVLVSAHLGKGNQGTNYVLRLSPDKRPSWIKRIFPRRRPAYTFRIDPRDEAGARALGELQDRGINLVANALAQSADHILSFLVMLRTELAFYLACANLHHQLGRKGVPVCFPVPAPSGARSHSCVGLRDVCLALSMDQIVVGNDLDADGKDLVIITGANKGGKSTFLRGVGLAQLMMQCGMFVAAESFSADIRRSLFTHYKREEDVTMKSGKFDEELSRMSGIADGLTPDSMLLFNESFGATNEREGSEIAWQIVRALLEARVKTFFVTHLYEFAHGLCEDKMDSATFLRAERQPDGRRTFKLVPGEPFQTSYGVDLYNEIFGGAADRTRAG